MDVKVVDAVVDTDKVDGLVVVTVYAVEVVLNGPVVIGAVLHRA